MVKLEDEAMGRAVRGEFESAWSAAERVLAPESSADDEPEDDPDSAGEEEPGKG